MQEITRLDFVKSSAGAAAGLTVFGALMASEADAHEHKHHHGSKQIVAWVSNVKKGQIRVMSGSSQVVIHDRKLAAAIARAAR